MEKSGPREMDIYGRNGNQGKETGTGNVVLSLHTPR
jgi:hypothetical protein